MGLLNETYKYITTHFKKIKLASSENEKRPEMHYDIYKKGFDFYTNYCCASRTEEKIKNFKQAKENFNRLLKEYPKVILINSHFFK